MTRETTCCFSGHRPSKLPWRDNESDPRCVALKKRIRQELDRAYDRGYRHFICGMALGSDLYFCEAAMDLRDTRPGVTLEAAIPCQEQADKWPAEQRLRYRELVDHCDFESVVQHHCDRSCFLRRDRYMVDRSSLLIAVYDGSSGGTQYTLTYAMAQNLETLILPPM